MATFRKRAGHWRAEVCVRNIRDSATFWTKAEAVEWASRREAELYANRGGRERLTLKQALARYRRDITPGHRGAKWEALRLDKISRQFVGVDTLLESLTAAQIAAWRDGLLAGDPDATPPRKPLAAASVRREMNVLRQVLGYCAGEWKLITREQLGELTDAKRPKEPPARRRGVTADEIDRIVLALGYMGGAPATVSNRVAIAWLLAIETAMRAGELCGIAQADLHLADRYVHLPKTKNADARDVPLTARAVELFRLLGDAEPALGLDTRRLDSLFRRARDRAGISNLHFHDSRSEALTRLSRKVDMLTLARIVGHRDPRSLMLYYAETASAIAARL